MDSITWITLANTRGDCSSAKDAEFEDRGAVPISRWSISFDGDDVLPDEPGAVSGR